MISSGQVKQSYVYLPNFHFTASNQVSPLYTSVPAPMGLANYGLGAAGSYTYYTSSFDGTVLLNSYVTSTPANAPLTASSNSSGIQFNTVMSNVTVGGTTNGVYWTQNVALINSTSLTFIDNIWNFSSSGASLNSNTIYSGNGIASNFYYDIGPTIPISYPLKLSFYNNASVFDNRPAVFFNYTYSVGGGPLVSGSYDTVLFNSSITPIAPAFEVNGSSSTPAGLLYDSELIFGGPGGGTNAMIQNLSGQATIYYLNGSGYSPVPSAYSYGTDTGETSAGISTYWMGRTGYLSQGPSTLSGLWNTAGGAAEGYITLNAVISPSWAFAFAGIGSATSFAPVTQYGNLNFTVSPNSYNILLMANYYSQFSTIFSSNTSTVFAMVSNPGLLYAPIYAVGNANALAITSLLSGPGRISNLTITLNASFMEANDFGYPEFILMAVEGVSTSLAVQSVYEANSLYYIGGSSYVATDYNQVYGFFSSSNSVIRNISMLASPTSAIAIIGSSNILVQNVSTNESGILIGYSNSIQVNQQNSIGGYGIVIVYSSSVSLGNLVVDPSAGGFAAGAIAEYSTSVSATNISVSAPLSGEYGFGVGYLATNNSSINNVVASGNVSSGGGNAYGAEVVFGSSDTASNINASSLASGFAGLYDNHLTLSNFNSSGGDFAIEAIYTNNSTVNQLAAYNGSAGFYGIDCTNISASGFYAANGALGFLDAPGNSSTLTNMVAYNQSAAEEILGNYVNVSNIRASDQSLAALVEGSYASVSGITALNNSTALLLALNDSVVSYVNGTFLYSGYSTPATPASLGFIQGGISNSTMAAIQESGYYYGVNISLSSSVLQNAQASSSAYGFILSGNDSSVSNVNSSYGGAEGFLIETDNSTFSNLYAYEDAVGISVTGSSNSITGSDISGDTGYGVSITAGTGNYVYNDNFVDNNGSTAVYSALHIQAYSVSGNYFNLSLTGNYWADWHTAYANGTLQPYLISNGVYDYHPLGSSAVTGYQVTFQSSGLPSGTEWFVNLTNGQSFHSTTSTISFYEPDSTYSYTVASGNRTYAPAAYTGSFTVSGSPVNVPVSFSLVTYAVTFTESGLSSGTGWSVTLGSQTSSSTTGSITFNEPNGTYQYSVGKVSGYTLSSSSGSLTVAGAATGAAVSFTAVTYAVTLTESGLPSGTSWSATLNGVKQTSSGTSITFNEPNGTYSFSVTNTTGYYASPFGGQITVSGTSANQNVQFTHYSYITGTVTPSNATVTVNGVTVATSGGSFNISEPAGSYSVVVSLTGYKTYYDNVTLSTGQTRNLPITLQAVSPASPSQSPLPLTDIIILVVIVVVIVAAVAAVAMTRRKGRK